MILNLQNIEELIFFDNKVNSLLPEFRNYFEQWRLSKRVPGLQNLGKRTVADLLNSIEKEQLSKLTKYFGEEILVEKIDYDTIKHEVFAAEVQGEDLCKFADYKDFCCHRDGDKLYITLWR